MRHPRLFSLKRGGGGSIEAPASSIFPPFKLPLVPFPWSLSVFEVLVCTVCIDALPSPFVPTQDEHVEDQDLD